MTLFGIDASSYQGRVNWAVVDALTAFGSEKVTEGTGYTNPYWLSAKAAMAARAKATGFIPMAYHFLDAGPGAPQADHFTAVAGNLSGFGIVLDFERAPNGPPSGAQARDCVARLRQHYPGHPIGLYAPHWYTGAAELTFGSWTWASSYVAGKQGPGALYAHVSASFWAAYGGRSPALLQFTETGIVPGVSGPVDVSAFRGTADQLRAIVLPGTANAKEAVVDHVTTGTESLAQIAEKTSTDPSTILRLTAAAEGRFDASTAEYINEMAASHTAPMPKGARLKVHGS